MGQTSDSMTVLKDVSIGEMVGPDALAVVRPTGVYMYLLDLFCFDIQF